MRERFLEAVEARPDVELKIVSVVASACMGDGGYFALQFDRREPLHAGVVLLATAYGLPASAPTGALAPFDVVPPDRLANAKSIALIGSGLTMVDVLLSARRDGFQGKATVISRRGQLPRPHAAKGIAQQEIGLARSKRVSGLTSAIAIGCAAAEAHGTPWQVIINGLRSSMQDIWQGLPVEEQARFLRHVRPLWDRPSVNSAWRHPCTSTGRRWRCGVTASRRELQADHDEAWSNPSRGDDNRSRLQLHRSPRRSCVSAH